MSSPVKHMSVVEYFRDARPWVTHRIDAPVWGGVKRAIERMDNYCFPIVLLSCIDPGDEGTGFDDENALNIIGGNGRFALFQYLGEWQYENPRGGTEEVRLWESDQGYFCQEKNVLRDIDHVLRIVKVFYETGRYENLNEVA